ncbi:MAG: hypothetical protein M3438_01010 [Pseudomonadota bacterium]|nr:hypothetical protein [Pseudomonadota bacterium]
MADTAHPDRRLRLAVLGTAGALMLLPVLAMRAVEQTPSDPSDFIFLAILLAGVAIAFEVAARVPRYRAYRTGVGFAATGAFLHTWINLAVGIIRNEDNPANLIFYAVLAVAIGGAIAARFKPNGMARAMLATAIAQMLVLVGALIAGLGFTGPITVFFTALWLIAAWLFQRAGRGASKRIVQKDPPSAR